MAVQPIVLQVFFRKTSRKKTRKSPFPPFPGQSSPSPSPRVPHQNRRRHPKEANQPRLSLNNNPPIYDTANKETPSLALSVRPFTDRRTHSVNTPLGEVKMSPKYEHFYFSSLCALCGFPLLIFFATKHFPPFSLVCFFVTNLPFLATKDPLVLFDGGCAVNKGET